MDKRYQVFVSSTYEDLRVERREVMKALLALDCVPTGMELFPAADDDSWTQICGFIDGCDYYVVILGGRYGSKGPSGKSYTEMEYDHAIKAGLPVLAFLHKDPGSITADKTEPTDEGKAALAAFRKKIEDSRHAKYWSAPGELVGAVLLGMQSLKTTKPRIGWVRANLVPDESAAKEILALRRKVEELETRLGEAETGPPPDTAELAQGDDCFGVHFRYQLNGQLRESVEEFSWNSILSLVGPILINTAGEEEIQEKLNDAFENRFRDRNRTVVYQVDMRDEDFQRIKVQLRALGLIQEFRGERNTRTWTLTPYGDRVMTRVTALRRPEASGKVAGGKSDLVR